MAVAYKSAGTGAATETSGAAVSPTCPATVDAGDVLIALAYYEGTTTAPGTPAGWSLLDGPRVVETTIGRMWLFGKIAAGTEDGAAVAFGTAAVTTMRSARIYSFSGRTAGTIWELARGFAFDTNAADPTNPGVTTTVAGSLAVLMIAQNDNNAMASLSGESGGDFTESVAEFTANLTPGLALSVQTAIPTADPGTITGGTDNTQNDPVGTIGFEIRPAVPATGVNARHFDGVDDFITVDNGSVVGTGAFSMFALVRKKVDNAAEFVAQVKGTAETWLLGISATNQVVCANGGSDSGNAGPTVKVDDGWCIVGWTRASGTVAARQHVFKAGGWTHTNFPTALGDGATAAVSIDFARWFAVLFYDIEIAVAGIWDSALSDGNAETLDNNSATQDWGALSPTALWDFGQAAITTDVVDLIGTGDQTARTGTDVVDHGPTGWAYGLLHTRTAAISAATSIASAGQVEAPSFDVYERSAAINASASITAANRIFWTTYERSAAISAASTVSAAANYWTTEARSAALSAASSITTAYTRDRLRAALLAATGQVSVSASFFSYVSRSGLISAAAALSAAPQRALLRSVSLSASAAIATAPERDLFRVVTLSHASSISTSGQIEGAAAEHVRSAALAASAALSAAPQRALARAVALTASAAVSAAAQRDHQRAAALTAAGAISSSGAAVAGAISSRSAALGATGDISVSGEVTPVTIVVGAAVLEASGELTAVGDVIALLRRSAALTAATAISSAAYHVGVRSASLTAASTLEAVGHQPLVRRSAALTAAATLTISGRIKAAPKDDLPTELRIAAVARQLAIGGIDSALQIVTHPTTFVVESRATTLVIDVDSVTVELAEPTTLTLDGRLSAERIFHSDRQQMIAGHITALALGPRTTTLAIGMATTLHLNNRATLLALDDDPNDLTLDDSRSLVTIDG